MTLIERIRAGYRPTLTDKLKTCGSIEELDAMLSTLRDIGHQLTEEELRASQERRHDLLRVEK